MYSALRPEANRRAGVALAMCYRPYGISIYRLNGLRKRAPRLYPSMVSSILYLYFIIIIIIRMRISQQTWSSKVLGLALSATRDRLRQSSTIFLIHISLTTYEMFWLWKRSEILDRLPTFLTFRKMVKRDGLIRLHDNNSTSEGRRLPCPRCRVRSLVPINCTVNIS